MGDLRGTDERWSADDLAAMYVFGSLELEDARELERRLAEGDEELAEAVCAFTESAAMLALAEAPAPPDPGLRQRVLDRIAENSLSSKPDPAWNLVRIHEGPWRDTGLPGVRFKELHRDADTGQATFLLKMRPGASYPAHRHRKTEQCLVLEGDVGWDEVRFYAGDFTCFPQESLHPKVQTTNGTLLLIIGATEVDFIHASL
ncbi:MAG: cupin domain-containing protein [Bryobacteraceae bacterium]